MNAGTNEFCEGNLVPINHPELPEIIDRFQREIAHYEELVNETHNKLHTIKRYDESLTQPDAKEQNPESALEELQQLLVRFYRLNDKARINLNHLRQII